MKKAGKNVENKENAGNFPGETPETFLSTENGLNAVSENFVADCNK